MIKNVPLLLARYRFLDNMKLPNSQRSSSHHNNNNSGSGFHISDILGHKQQDKPRKPTTEVVDDESTGDEGVIPVTVRHHNASAGATDADSNHGNITPANSDDDSSSHSRNGAKVLDAKRSLAEDLHARFTAYHPHHHPLFPAAARPWLYETCNNLTGKFCVLTFSEQGESGIGAENGRDRELRRVEVAR